MLDIKFIRENSDLIKEAARKKHLSFNVDELLAAEERRLDLLSDVEKMRAEQNVATDKIAQATDHVLRQAMIDEMTATRSAFRRGEDACGAECSDRQDRSIFLGDRPRASSGDDR